MAPTGTRQTTNRRAEQAWDLRVAGRTWPEIARQLGYGTANSARKAVTTWLRKNPNDDLETMRRASGAMLLRTTRKLAEALDDAIADEQFRTAAELGKVVLDGIEKHAKLTGQHVVVPTVVDVTVTQTMAEMIGDTRAKLLEALAAEQPAIPAPPPVAALPVLDAEIIEDTP